MLVEKNGKKTSDFWDLKSIELISLLIEFLLENTSKIYQNIGNVYYLLENLAGNEDAVNGLFADKSTESQWRAYKSVIANSEKTKSNIISSAISHLSFIGKDPSLLDVTIKYRGFAIGVIAFINSLIPFQRLRFHDEGGGQNFGYKDFRST